MLNVVELKREQAYLSPGAKRMLSHKVTSTVVEYDYNKETGEERWPPPYRPFPMQATQEEVRAWFANENSDNEKWERRIRPVRFFCAQTTLSFDPGDDEEKIREAVPEGVVKKLAEALNFFVSREMFAPGCLLPVSVMRLSSEHNQLRALLLVYPVVKNWEMTNEVLNAALGSNVFCEGSEAHESEDAMKIAVFNE